MQADASTAPSLEEQKGPAVIHVDSILSIRQYSERVKAIYAWGKQTDQKFTIDTFGEGTFEALSGICAARGALANETLISSSKFVTHPSSLVRRTSVSSGLLSSAEAKAIFLSEDSSRETQRMLVRTCASLPADEDTLALARKLDEEGGFSGGGMAWTVLAHTQDEAFFLQHAPLCTPAARAWQSSGSQPLSLALVHRFPKAILELTIKKQLFDWRFNWLAALAQHGAEPLFKFLLNTTPQISKIDALVEKLVVWGWKPFYTLLLAMTEKGQTVNPWTRTRLLQALRGSRATFNMKLEAVLSVFPKVGQPNEAVQYIALLPSCNEKRTEHCAELLTGFWGLVSAADAKKPWDLFRVLATQKTLPNSILVKEFLAKHTKIRSAPLADTNEWKKQELAVFSFVLGLCQVDSERLQVLLALFSRADVVTPGGALELFVSFRTSVESSTSLKEGFDAVANTLGGKAVKTELQAVVSKMSLLETKESDQNPAMRVTAEGLPRNWVLFCGGNTSATSVGLFLRSTLLNLAEGPLLQALITTFGRSWFWELFLTVLKGADSLVLSPEAAKPSSAAFPASLLSQLTTVLPSVDEKTEQPSPSGETKQIHTLLDPVYRAKEEEVKKRTFGKDYLERQRAYLELLEMCVQAGESSKPSLFADAIPFLVKRLDREQETVKFAVLPTLLSAFPALLWIPSAKDQLAVLWNSCFHARTCNTTWKTGFAQLCNQIASHTLAQEWSERSAAAIEICTLVLSEVDRNNFVQLLITAVRAKRSKGENLFADAVEWCIENALGPNPTAEELLQLVKNLDASYGSQEKVWQAIPGIDKRWKAIHETPVTPAVVDFLLVGTYKHFQQYNEPRANRGETVWWEPITDPIYEGACSKALAKLAELVGPARAMGVCGNRIQQVIQVGLAVEHRARYREETIQTATNIVNNERGLELRQCLSQALVIGQTIVDPALPSADRLLVASLDALDAVVEGRARVVCQSDSDFNRRWTSPDLLSELVDQYLTTSKSTVLDRRVLELCHRADAHLLLFFGKRFSTHLCLRRQAELHTFLEKLTPFPSDDSQALEFYHWELEQHALSQLTCLGVPLAMLHPATQTLLLQKGLLGSTRLPNLTALPTLEYVDTTSNILEILDAHPRAQTPAVAADASRQPQVPKNPNDLVEVATCRFRNLPPPTRTDEVQQKHVDTLILALGHADHTDRAMTVLSKYAGWHKFARDALVRTIKTLARPHARRVLANLITPSGDKSEKMGLSTLVHMLRLALELRVDRVVDICKAAFREGQCHRDVLAVMLSKLVVIEGFSAEDLQIIRSFYHLSSTSRDKDDQIYIVRTVLQDIKSLKPWTLPFVCEVISSDWCYVPGAAGEAFSALQCAVTCGAKVTGVAEALTRMLSSARVLSNVEFHDSHTLAADWKVVSASTAASSFVSSHKLHECDRGALSALVKEVFGSPAIDKNLGPALNLWLPLAKTDLQQIDWVATQLKEFEASGVGQAFQQLVDTTLRCTNRAVPKRAIQIAREAVGPTTPQGAQLLTTGWARLVAHDNDEKELAALLHDEVALKHIVPVARVLCGGPHRWAALEWLSQSTECTVAPAPGLPALVELCINVFGEKKAQEADVKRVLDLFKRHQESPVSIKLIQGLADKGPVSREVQRLGLQWLTPLFPRAAVQMYPKFLSRFEPPSVEDVNALLAACLQYHVEVPPLTHSICRVACANLLASPLVEARVLAARALGKDQRFSELKQLLTDSSAVVRSVAQSLLPLDAPKKATDDANADATKQAAFDPNSFDLFGGQ